MSPSFSPRFSANSLRLGGEIIETAGFRRKIKISLNFATEMTEAQNIKPLPAEIDHETTIFSYGSLLDHDTLREILKARGEFKILETVDLTEAARLVRNNPKDIVILKNVRLENVRVSIVTERMLRRWYRDGGGDPQMLASAGALPEAVFLYARPARAGEKGRSLNGGLICNFRDAEILTLDRYEWEPVLKRARTPELQIGDRRFVPQHITFYAGTVSTAGITPEEKAERSRLLNLNRTPGQKSPHAKWPEKVRKKSKK
jgi:hypothetical protein